MYSNLLKKLASLIKQAENDFEFEPIKKQKKIQFESPEAKAEREKKLKENLFDPAFVYTLNGKNWEKLTPESLTQLKQKNPQQLGIAVFFPKIAKNITFGAIGTFDMWGKEIDINKVLAAPEKLLQQIPKLQQKVQQQPEILDIGSDLDRIKHLAALLPENPFHKLHWVK